MESPAALARRRHFGDFYRISETHSTSGEPLGLVMGNCQAESLRIALGDSTARFVRTPPIHELVADDMPYLQHWLHRSDVLISQPVAAGYHGLPLGTGELIAGLRSGARSVVFPVIRFAGLYPYHVIVRPPSAPSLSPPLVAYHDLRLLGEASDGVRRGNDATAARIRAIADESRAQLEERERRHGAIAISDLFERPHFELMRTINHPGNPVWAELARRILERLGTAADPADPGRPLLDSVHAPREASTIEAWGLGDDPTDHWLIAGARVPAEQVREAHLDWYRKHPEVISAGLVRHATAARALGIA